MKQGLLAGTGAGSDGGDIGGCGGHSEAGAGHGEEAAVSAIGEEEAKAADSESESDNDGKVADSESDEEEAGAARRMPTAGTAHSKGPKETRRKVAAHRRVMSTDSPSKKAAGVGAGDNTINFQMAYNQFLEAPDRAWWNVVNDKLIVGAIPCRNMDHQNYLYKHCGVRAVVSLVMRDEFQPNVWATPVTEDDWEALSVAQLVRRGVRVISTWR